MGARQLVLLVPLLLLSLASCHRWTAARLEGHWRGTTVEGVAPEALPNALAFGKAVEWEVAGDQLVVLSPLGRQVGKFSVEGDNGGVLTIRTDLDGATTRETLTFLNDKSFRWTVNESKGLAIVFLRD